MAFPPAARRTVSIVALALALGGCFPGQLQQQQILKTNAVFSPDGSQIAYISNEDGDWDIYLMDSDGANTRNVTDSATNEAAPAWSPDGASIVFSSDRSGQWEIYIMNADGSNERRLTGADEEADDD